MKKEERKGRERREEREGEREGEEGERGGGGEREREGRGRGGGEGKEGGREEEGEGGKEERWEGGGVVKGREDVIDWAAVGYAVEVSLRITIDKAQPQGFDQFLAAARDIPEVIEIQTFLGRVDLRLSVLARDMAHYQELYRDRILTLPHIADIEALMHVASVKSDEGLPI